MSFKKENLIKEISRNLAFSSKEVTLKNIIGLFDSNRVAQEFFAQLFSLIFGYDELKELDKLNDVVNYPAVDLGDEKAKIAFQITTQKDSQKIKDTIEKFLSHELYKKYKRLVVFIIGEKQEKYSVDFDTKNKFVFNKESDIWDDGNIIKEIDKLDIKKLEKIKVFLEENLQEYKFPDSLSYEDIKNCIQILKRDFGYIEKLEKTLNIQRNSSDFIKDIKNFANNVSWEFFKEKIRGHILYNDEIIEFLQNPINKDIESDYHGVSQAIQDFYKNPENKYTSFEKVFADVFDKVKLLYNDDIANKTKILILLHNMYFNCDIGDNSIKKEDHA